MITLNHYYYRIKSNSIPRITQTSLSRGRLDNISYTRRKEGTIAYRHYLCTVPSDETPKLITPFTAVDKNGKELFTLSNEYWITKITQKLLTTKK